MRHVAYCIYYATGEGVTVFIALGGSSNHAEKIFKDNAPEYFHRGMEMHEMGTDPSEQAAAAIGMIPARVLEIFDSNPPGTTDWFSMLHYNLS